MLFVKMFLDKINDVLIADIFKWLLQKTNSEEFVQNVLQVKTLHQ